MFALNGDRLFFSFFLAVLSNFLSLFFTILIVVVILLESEFDKDGCSITHILHHSTDCHINFLLKSQYILPYIF